MRELIRSGSPWPERFRVKLGMTCLICVRPVLMQSKTTGPSVRHRSYSRPMRIGFDLGGANVRVGLVRNGDLADMQQAPTPADGSGTEVLELIYALPYRMPVDRIESIGAGVPSVVDPESRMVYDVQNIPSWTIQSGHPS